MSIYSDITESLNKAANEKKQYARELNAVAAAFALEANRVLGAGDAIEYGAMSDDGEFVPATIGPLNETQGAQFVLAVSFQVDSAEEVRHFPVVVQKTKAAGMQLFVAGRHGHTVAADQPSSFIEPSNDLSAAIWDWVRDVKAESQLV